MRELAGIVIDVVEVKASELHARWVRVESERRATGLAVVAFWKSCIPPGKKRPKHGWRDCMYAAGWKESELKDAMFIGGKTDDEWEEFKAADSDRHKKGGNSQPFQGFSPFEAPEGHTPGAEGEPELPEGFSFSAKAQGGVTQFGSFVREMDAYETAEAIIPQLRGEVLQAAVDARDWLNTFINNLKEISNG